MNASHANPVLRLLLVEDDPVSAAFLADAAALLPLRVESAADAAAAHAACRNARFDLLLIDANLPDGSGADLLRALRADGQTAPALAHTAAAGTDEDARLLDAGFAVVLRKPITLAELHAALRRHLDGHDARPWDDAAALAALGGRPQQVAALRRMFLDELPAQRVRIAAALAHADAGAVGAELHRLTASCGFVGAVALARAAHTLRARRLDAQRWQALDAAIAALLNAPAPTPPERSV